jgi:hypothetical protein
MAGLNIAFMPGRADSPERVRPEADEGTRTLDLLHGKQTL